MKKPLLITIFILLGAGGFLFYNHYHTKKTVIAWDLVPEETVLVFESGTCKSCIEEIKGSPIATLIKNAAFHEIEKDSLGILQEFAGSFNEPTLVSLHITKKDEFDFAFFIRKSPAFLQKFGLLIDPLLKLKSAKRTERELNNTVIHEIKLNKNVFSWIEVDDVWVGSFSPVIIEDVIRTHTGQNQTFKQALGNVYQLPRVKNDGGNLFVNLTNLAQWISLFTQDQSQEIFKNFGTAALLDAKISSDKIVLNGFSSQLNSKMFLNAFSDQAPVPFSLNNIISNRALMVSSYGLSNGKTFFERLHTSIKNPFADSLAVILKEVNVSPSEVFNNFSGEIAMCWLEGRNETTFPVLIINDSEHIAKWKFFFNALSETVVSDTVFVDRYSNYEIKEIPIYRFPEKLFYPIVSGFNTSYYTQVGSSICISENIEELKRFLQDIEQENTWGKSVAQNKFFESTLLEANISLFINTPKVLTMLENNLRTKWKTFLKANQKTTSSLGMGAIQFSHLNESYYTNLAWSLTDTKILVPETRDNFMTVFDSNISSMMVADSHVGRSKEILVQDTARNLTLLSAEGKILWKLPIDGFIQGQVSQIDFFNNGKLQFFFCTPGKMHVIDRLGNYVRPYPVSIPENNIEFVSIVDYDHSKKYRFMVASRDGNAWIFDKEGKNLDGWQPKNIQGGLIAAPRHHRILGKDYMVAIRRDGVVNLMNRRGEVIRNFPLDLKSRLSGDYFVETGRNTDETAFTVVSTEGTKIKFNLQGKVLSREVLVKTALDARFSLCAERDGKSFLILRQESKNFTVLDEKSNEILKSDFIGNGRAEVKFLLFGNGRNYIVLTDHQQDLSFIYDRGGQLITSFPIESSHIDIVPENNNRIKVFSAVDNTFKVTYVP